MDASFKSNLGSGDGELFAEEADVSLSKMHLDILVSRKNKIFIFR
jgi:hypothetical protein